MKCPPRTEQITKTAPEGHARQRLSNQCLVISETADGLPAWLGNPFPPSPLAEVSGCLHVDGPARTLEQMEQAIRQGMAEARGMEDEILELFSEVTA
ncbi:MAG: hypothetical protein BWK76_07460 [Desulfobulbaceae bacterium A2]|nr:MAG: hypothetical protein BWK76_07460 [Desulfobulbaceae bacterium A2]